MKIKLLIALIVILLVVLLPEVSLAQISSGQQQIAVRETAQVNEVGDVHLEATYTYAANYYTTAIAPSKINPFLIPEVRFIRSGQSNKEIPRDSIKVEFYDASSSIKVTYDAMGFTINKKDYWEIETIPGAMLASQTGTTVVLTSTQQQDMNTLLTTTTITFPEEAKDINFNSGTGKIKYTLPDDPPGNFPFIWIIAGVIGIIVIAGLLVLLVFRKKIFSKA